MSRFASAIPLVFALAAASPASAQYYQGGYYQGGYSPGGYGDPGHYDVIPGHYHQHGNHLDYHPPQVLYYYGNHYQAVSPQATFYPGTTYPQGYPSQGYPAQGYPSQPYPQTAEAAASPHAGPPPEPGSVGHVDDVALAFERATNQMCLEMYYNYRPNPGWIETYREAYEILDTAKRVHAMEHAGDRDRMRQEMTRIDGLFHHVRDDVRHWARYGGQFFGPGGLRARMDEVEDALHHLMQDIGAPAPEDLQAAPAAQAPPPVAPAAPNAGPATPAGTPSTMIPYAPQAQP